MIFLTRPGLSSWNPKYLESLEACVVLSLGAMRVVLLGELFALGLFRDPLSIHKRVKQQRQPKNKADQKLVAPKGKTRRSNCDGASNQNALCVAVIAHVTLASKYRALYLETTADEADEDKFCNKSIKNIPPPKKKQKKTTCSCEFLNNLTRGEQMANTHLRVHHKQSEKTLVAVPIYTRLDN